MARREPENPGHVAARQVVRGHDGAKFCDAVGWCHCANSLRLMICQ